MKFLILPNQLFEYKYLPKDIDEIILIEEPVYYGYRNKKFNFNKIKLVLHRASMKYYEDYIKNKYNVQYIEFKNKLPYKKILSEEIQMFNPYDHYLEKKYKKYNKKILFLDTPNFILNENDIETYYNKNKGNYQHVNFYNYVKNKIKILENKKSYDQMNRDKLPKNIKIPSLPKLNNNDIKYINEAKIYIDKKFPKNYGDTANFIYPISHKTSEKWLENFIQNKFNKFGKYQDAIDNENIFLFHSVISPMLNIGLLTPIQVINEINNAYKKKSDIKINDFEGYFRQIAGWREYQRLIYKYEYKNITNMNLFKNKNKLNKNWYVGETGIIPIDFFIKQAFKYGYLHHISRLMGMANIMNLCEIHPDEVYKWFMEFSVDSYDWVMIQNVYSMGLWVDKGLTMRKPYITTDNYIMKMGNFEKGEWNDIWTSLFYNFIDNNNDIMQKTPYGRNYVYFKKLSNDKKKKIKNQAKKFIKNNTK
jgi:deoxyribodipyrimidine photolyase-related protein